VTNSRVAAADVLPERLPERYGPVTIRRVVLILAKNGKPVAELRIWASAELEIEKPKRPIRKEKQDNGCARSTGTRGKARPRTRPVAACETR
jgi:hypothetical protein